MKFSLPMPLLLLVVCAATGARVAFASTGTSGAVFLDIPVGAGPTALGSGYSALASDAYAPVWNPAGLGFLDSPQIGAQHLSYLESTHEEFFSGVVPFGQGHGLGVSAQYLGSGDIPATDGSGISLGTYNDSFGAYSLAYGHAFTEKLSLGLTGKIVHEHLDTVSATAFGMDFGSLYKVSERLTLAAVVANVGSKLKLLSESDSLPLKFRFAAAFRPLRSWMVTAEADAEKGAPAGGHFGTEWKPIDLLALRVGYRTETLKELSALAGFSTGIALNWWGQEFSYAWQPYSDLGNTHYFSLVLRFGAPDERHARSMQYPHDNRRPDPYPTKELPGLE